MMLATNCYESPVGLLEISVSIDFVVSVLFARGVAPAQNTVLPITRGQQHMLDWCERELTEYFGGARKEFTVPCRPTGTAFQQRAWQVLREIPYGQTITYGQQAVLLNQPGAAQAVGLCNGANPLAVVVPCHRVVGARGQLTGYGGGLAAKQWLLDHERRHSPPTGQTHLF